MRILGLDGGIASIGWALIELDDVSGGIVTAGVRMFDAPETDKERTPTNAVRRLHRGQRRVIRRRRQRMTAIRDLFMRHALLSDAAPDALRRPALDPWCVRVLGLDHRLTPEEFAVALGHIARHRAFRSNAKSDRGTNAAADTSKMLKAIAATQERLGQWRTVGEMVAHDPEFIARKRNRGGDFSRSLLRKDLEDEVRMLFATQRRLGNGQASEALEAAFADAAFSQRPLQNADHLVGDCPFELGEKRAARRSYGFELFRLLSRLANMSVVEGRLMPDQIRVVADNFGAQKKITYKTVRRLLRLRDVDRFADVGPDDEGRDVVARSGNAAEGSHALREAVGDAGWRVLLAAPARLDAIAGILSFRDDLGEIRQGLNEIGLEPLLIEAVMAAAEAGKFIQFKGAGHISAKAAQTLIPHLARGLRVDEACVEVRYDPAARAATKLEDIRNPTARKALGEMLKQVRALVQEFGLPDRIHVELARDVGKSAEERDKIKDGIEKTNKQRDRHRTEFTELIHREPTGLEEMLRYELWKEQGGRCLYSDEAISPGAIVATDNSVQVDHILPWSRFGDDSFVNKTLCTARANQQKKGRTPFEWFQAEKTEAEWGVFVAGVESCKALKSRKQKGFYLRQNAAEVEKKFRSRNLNDTRYATRLLLEFLARLYPPDKRQVLARPGALTAKLRRAWGVDDLKKDTEGNRLGDQHHALDALVLAATSERMLQELTDAAKAAERSGASRGFDFKCVESPWEGFREEVRAAVGNVFVCRAERRRVPGQAHDATIKQVRGVNGAQVVFERKAVDNLTLADLDRIPVPDPYGKAADPAKLRHEMVATLRAWIEAGKPKNDPPRSPKGDTVRKVRVATTDKIGVELRGGTADRGDMARVDVFAKADKQGRREFFLVPIYPHQVADVQNWPQPPDQAISARQPETSWVQIDTTFSFLFSIYIHSLIEVIRDRGGEVVRGYFKGLDRDGGQISIAMHDNLKNIRTRIGTRTLLSFRKFAIDRLGRTSEIKQETRTWHGVVCT